MFLEREEAVKREVRDIIINEAVVSLKKVMGKVPERTLRRWLLSVIR